MNDSVIYVISDNSDFNPVDGFPKERVLFRFLDKDIADYVFNVLKVNYDTPFGFTIRTEKLNDEVFANETVTFICNEYEKFGKK